MISKILILVTGLLLGSGAVAQEFGAVIGLHQTEPDSDVTNVTVDGKMGFKAGLGVQFELVPGSKFRTGLLYTQRHFDVDQTIGTTKYTYEYKFAYLDVPALYQYNFNEMVGLFGGLVAAINVNDDVEVPAVIKAAFGDDVDAESMIPLLTLGVNLTFTDMIGFDFYYERGLGDVAINLENYSTFGANFIYWF